MVYSETVVVTQTGGRVVVAFFTGGGGATQVGVEVGGQVVEVV